MNMNDHCPPHRSSGKMTELSDSLKQRVYYAARDGMAITLFALLAEKHQADIQQLLDYVMEDDGQRCSPLIIASRNGHDKVVKLLITKFQPNLEQEGTVKFDGYVIEGASPLWCAAGAGHLNVVKTLVKHGANVNHPTKTNSTPLRAACFDGRLDIVRYLTEHDADIHIANKYNNTCLMIASYKGHLDVVNYLLEKGANPNVNALCGATALHFSAECGHVQIVKELLEHGALMPKNEHGMTPLVTASERTKAEVVEYLIGQSFCSQDDRIEALELLGASFANDKDNYSLEKAFYYLEWAMRERYKDTNCIIRKLTTKAIKAYVNRVECQTPEDLEAIRNNESALHMEALVIRERILGPQNPEVPHPIVFRGAVFADSSRFDRCVALWLHALRLRQNNGISVTKDLLRFAQVFSQMLHIGVDLPFNCVREVLERAVMEIELNKTKLDASLGDERDNMQEEMDSNIHTVLYLLILVSKLLKKCTEKQEFLVYQLVYKLNSNKICTKDGVTPLHLAVNAETPVDDFHTNDVCTFPCSAAAKLLIQCGADVNALDKDRNTPLHLIVTYEKPISDFFTLHSIIVTLIKAGAHMDTVNNEGETPFEAATTGVAEIILRQQSKLSLKCMAAKAVKKYNIAYQGQVPQTLESFIELHGVAKVNLDGKVTARNCT